MTAALLIDKLREAEKANTPFLTALPGALRRCYSLVWLNTQRSERLALHPASAPKNGILAISASLRAVAGCLNLTLRGASSMRPIPPG